jgi:hypothetical protein
MIVMHSESEKMRNRMVMIYFEVISKKFPEITEEHHKLKNLTEDNWPRIPPKYKSGRHISPELTYFVSNVRSYNTP